MSKTSLFKMKIKYFLLLAFTANIHSNFFDAWSEFNKRNRSDLWEVASGSNTSSQKNSKTNNSKKSSDMPTFADVIGGVPAEFNYLKNQMIKGENIPKGILLQGPPGTGKTHLVRAFSGETGAKIFNVSASQLMGSYVGDGPRNVKKAFDEARSYIKSSKLPAIIFFDEFDAIGKRYEDSVNAAIAEESKKTINELLFQMDGFTKDENIVVVAATNKADLIDEALKRPGRLDFIVSVNLPDTKKRSEILSYYVSLDKNNKFKEIDFNELAELSGGFNCAELKQLVVEAALIAKSKNSMFVLQEHFKLAVLSRKKVKKIDFKEQSCGDKKITFKDIVGGVPPEILDLKSFLENDEALEAVGAQKPSGILMVGPPGTGKTMLAKAVAGEIDAAFFSESASSFIQKYVGTGPQKVREIFDNAKKALLEGSAKKVIIFLDEIDSIGSRDDATNLEYRNTINELLTQMDGFGKNENITVLAATNRPDLLDSALKRPGRFDYIIEVPLPDFYKRKEILNHYMFSVPRNVDSGIDFNDLAKKTEGFNCADLRDLINRSAINAVRYNRKIILKEDVDVSLNEIKKSKLKF